MIGEPMPGLTARRLKLIGSRSSSRRRLLLIRRVISAAVGTPFVAPGKLVLASVVEEDEDVVGGFPGGGRAKGVGPCFGWLSDFEDGESMLMSSMLMADDEPLGSPKFGGVRIPLLLAPLSENVSQNILPLEFFRTCCLKLLLPGMPPGIAPGVVLPLPLLLPFESIIIIASTSSMLSWAAVRLGLVKAEVGNLGSRSMSLSRTCRTTSASRLTSASIGALSSRRAARMRAKPLVLG